jgi:hypothetical protein
VNSSKRLRRAGSAQRDELSGDSTDYAADHGTLQEFEVQFRRLARSAPSASKAAITAKKCGIVRIFQETGLSYPARRAQAVTHLTNRHCPP